MTIHLPKALLLAVGFVLAAGAVGLGGYLLGRASIDQQGVRTEAFADGRRRGIAQGRREAPPVPEDTRVREDTAVIVGLNPKAGRFYIVSFMKTPSLDTEFGLKDSYRMAQGTSYTICAAGDGICEQ